MAGLSKLHIYRLPGYPFGDCFTPIGYRSSSDLAIRCQQYLKSRYRGVAYLLFQGKLFQVLHCRLGKVLSTASAWLIRLSPNRYPSASVVLVCSVMCANPGALIGISTTTGDCCDVKSLFSYGGIRWSSRGCHEFPFKVPVLVYDPFSDCRRLIPFGRSSRFCSPLEPLISFTSNQEAKAIPKASSKARVCCLADRNTYLILTRACSSLSNH